MRMNPITTVYQRILTSDDTEHVQAFLRVGVATVAIVYVAGLRWFEVADSAAADAGLVGFLRNAPLLYAIVNIHLVLLAIHPKKLLWRRLAMVLLDNAMVTYLAAHGYWLSPFVCFYPWLAIGYGFRFGPNWLAYSAAVSAIGIGWIVSTSPSWIGHTSFAVTLVMTLLAVCVYAYVLLTGLQRAHQELARRADELARLASHDALTGLANRSLLAERLTRAIALSPRVRCGVGVVYFDIDGFKAVNDVYGHAVGDEVLIQVAKRVGARLRQTDTFGRIAGDEFVIVLEGLKSREEGRMLAKVVLQEVTAITKVADHPITITASLGVAWLADDDQPTVPTADSMLRAADAGMYQAKRGGKNQVHVCWE